MKRQLTYSLLLALIITLMIPTNASAVIIPPIFTVDGRIIETPAGEPAPYVNKEYRTMGSLRFVGQALGVKSEFITWDKTTQTATLTHGSNKVEVTISKKEMKVNGKTVVMDTVAETKQGRVFIPVKFIAEGLGVYFEFNEANGYFNIYTIDPIYVSMDNFDDLGLERISKLPITLTTPDGLNVTVNSAYLYNTSSTVAKTLHQKYDLWDFNKASELVLMNVTLENTGDNVITPLNEPSQIIYMSYSDEGYFNSTFSSTEGDFIPWNSSTEILGIAWMLYPGEKITVNLGFLKIGTDEITEIGIIVGTQAGFDIEFIVLEINK